jgi:iron(III) transport system substrate-binding protein
LDHATGQSAPRPNIGRRAFSRACLVLPVALVALWGSSAIAEAAGTKLQERFADLYKAAAKEGSVVFYNDLRQDAAQRVSAFWKENFPDVQLKMTLANSLALIAQVETEQAAGQHQADVTHMSQPNAAIAWKKKGLYQPYKVSTFANFSPDYADPDGAYYSADVYVLPAAYNTKAFPDKSGLPTSLADYLDPKWKGKIVLADPATAGNGLTFLMTMLDKGFIDWPYLEKLAKQDVLFVRNNPDAVRMVASGERVLSPMLSSFNVVPAKHKGQPIDSYLLKEGAVVVESPFGIMAGAPHPNAAKLLLEALMRPEGQVVLTESGAFWPADSTAKLPEGVPTLADMRPIVPPVVDQAKMDAFLTRFKQTFGRR